jgi:hypothetical protein
MSREERAAGDRAVTERGGGCSWHGNAVELLVGFVDTRPLLTRGDELLLAIRS